VTGPRRPPTTDLAEPRATTAVAAAGQGYARAVWRQLRADRLALAAGVLLASIILACFAGAPVAAALLGHSADKYFAYGTSYGTTGSLDPVGPWTRIPDQADIYPLPTKHTKTTLFILGADGQLGRDEFLRLLYGGRTTLEIGFGGSVAALLIGLLVGTIGGFVGGATDAVLSRSTEFVAAFPLLLLVTALGWTISNRLNAITLGPLFEQGVVSLIVLIGLFTWPYPARLVRAQVLALREREFVEASRMIGAGRWRIIRTHILPHLAATMIVYSTLIVAGNIVLEAALSALNFGLQHDIPDWGQMLSENFGTLIATGNGGFESSVWTQVCPAAAIGVTVVALSLFGEALRKAADPRSSRFR
jgi:peptide/nickel transport system permease protein